MSDRPCATSIAGLQPGYAFFSHMGQYAAPQRAGHPGRSGHGGGDGGCRGRGIVGTYMSWQGDIGPGLRPGPEMLLIPSIRGFWPPGPEMLLIPSIRVF